MMNETFITCLAILMIWYILFSGNTQFLKANEKPKVDKYITIIHLRIASFDSNWDKWEENGVIYPNTIQQASMEGKWIAYQNNLRTILHLDFR